MEWDVKGGGERGVMEVRGKLWESGCGGGSGVGVVGEVGRTGVREMM